VYVGPGPLGSKDDGEREGARRLHPDSGIRDPGNWHKFAHDASAFVPNKRLRAFKH